MAAKEAEKMIVDGEKIQKTSDKDPNHINTKRIVADLGAS